jgi:6-carboxyhexanoate--CoA ligase
MTDHFYSIRMHASYSGRHLSGAERITTAGRINMIAGELLRRALDIGTPPDHISVVVDNLQDRSLREMKALNVVTMNLADMRDCHAMATRILQGAGISEQALLAAFRFLRRGTVPSGDNMRGAMIMDARSGERLEPDQERGVRASRFDWSEDALEKIKRNLASSGLTHHRTHEALALATKVAHAPGMVAELCWSDDPEYTAGYVASAVLGYVRFPHMKQRGDPKGGRVFFINHDVVDLATVIGYLEDDPVLITEIGECRSGIPDEHFESGI